MLKIADSEIVLKPRAVRRPDLEIDDLQVPLAIRNGGTGAKTASQARVKLGLGSTDVVTFGGLSSQASSFNLLNEPASIVAFAGARSGVTFGNLNASNAFNGLQRFYYAGPSAGIWLSDTRAYSTTPRFALDFVERYNTSGVYAAMAQISGGKENATNNDLAGTIALRTRPNGGAMTTAITIASNQVVTFSAVPVLASSSSPASNGAGVAGMVTWDSSYIYVCVAANTWKRAALAGGY